MDTATPTPIRPDAEAKTDENGNPTLNGWLKGKAVLVGSVSGHPIYFQLESGKLLGYVFGKEIAHGTLSTLRKLMAQAIFDASPRMEAFTVERQRVDSQGYVSEVVPRAGRATLIKARRSAVGAYRTTTEREPSFTRADGMPINPNHSRVYPADQAEAITAKLLLFKAQAQEENDRHARARRDLALEVIAYLDAQPELSPQEVERLLTEQG